MEIRVRLVLPLLLLAAAVVARTLALPNATRTEAATRKNPLLAIVTAGLEVRGVRECVARGSAVRKWVRDASGYTVKALVAARLACLGLPLGAGWGACRWYAEDLGAHGCGAEWVREAPSVN